MPEGTRQVFFLIMEMYKEEDRLGLTLLKLPQELELESRGKSGKVASCELAGIWMQSAFFT